MFCFSTSELGVFATKTLMIVEGQRNRPIAVAIHKRGSPAIAASTGATKSVVPEKEAMIPSAAPATPTTPPTEGTSSKEASEPAPPPEPATASDLEPKKHGRSAFPYLLGGLGLASVGAGALLTLWGRQDNAALSACAPNCAASDLDHIKTLYLASDIAFGVGAAAVGVATVMLVAGGARGARRRRTPVSRSTSPPLRPGRSRRFGGPSDMRRSAKLRASCSVIVWATLVGGCIQQLDTNASSNSAASAAPPSAGALTSWELCQSPSCDEPDGYVPPLTATPVIYLPDGGTATNPCDDVEAQSVALRQDLLRRMPRPPREPGGARLHPQRRSARDRALANRGPRRRRTAEAPHPRRPVRLEAYQMVATGLSGSNAGMPPSLSPAIRRSRRPWVSDMSVLYGWIFACVPGGGTYVTGGGAGYGPGLDDGGSAGVGADDGGGSAGEDGSSPLESEDGGDN